MAAADLGNLNANVLSAVAEARGQAALGQSKALEGGSDASEQAAEQSLLRKLAIKKQEIVKQETYQKVDSQQANWRQVVEGRQGPGAAQAAQAWQNHGELQQKLTEHQRNAFQSAFVADPQRGTAASQALVDLAQQPGFAAAVPNSQQMGELQAQILANPQIASAVKELLQSSFMQAPRGDAAVKSDFLQFGLSTLNAPPQLFTGPSQGARPNLQLPPPNKSPQPSTKTAEPLRPETDLTLPPIDSEPPPPSPPRNKLAEAANRAAYRAAGPPRSVDPQASQPLVSGPDPRMAVDPVRASLPTATIDPQTGKPRAAAEAPGPTPKAGLPGALAERSIPTSGPPASPLVDRFTRTPASASPTRQAPPSSGANPSLATALSQDRFVGRSSTDPLAPIDPIAGVGQSIGQPAALPRDGASPTADRSTLPEDGSSRPADRFTPPRDGQTKPASQLNTLYAAQTARLLPPQVGMTSKMLSTVAQAGTPAFGQAAALKMVRRNAQNLGGIEGGIEQVDRFVRSPSIARLPAKALGGATAVLARGDGAAPVDHSLQVLTQDVHFVRQSAEVKGRLFMTLVGGRPSEMRALTDKALQVLQSPSFPQREAQVSRLLGKLGKQIKTGGAAGVDVQTLVAGARRSTLPAPPTLLPTASLKPPEQGKAVMHNRAAIMDYYQQINRHYDRIEGKMDVARYLEQVNLLPNLRPAEEVQTSALTPEELAFAQERHVSSLQRLAQVQRLQASKMSTLSTRRMPRAKLAARQAQRLERSRQPRYFTPGDAQRGASRPKTMAAAAPAPGSPAPRTGLSASATASASNPRAFAQPAGSAVQSFKQLPASMPLEAKLERTYQMLQERLANDMQQLRAHLSEEVSGAAPARSPQPAASPGPKAVRLPTDGFGIPKAVDRDLGGAQPARIIKPPVGSAGVAGADAAESTEAEAIRLSNRSMLKPGTKVRPFAELMTLSWKTLSKPESALLRNLGWTGPLWNARNAPRAAWPTSMRQSFAEQRAKGRQAIRELGFTDTEWDRFVEPFAG